MVGEIQNLVLSEHVIRSSQAMVDGHEWPRMRQRVTRMQSHSGRCWRCGREHGSYLKEESQGSGHRVPGPCLHEALIVERVMDCVQVTRA